MAFFGDPIRSFSGEILGWVETDARGIKTYRKHSGEITGRYDPFTNKTTNFSGVIESYGDTGAVTIFRK